MQQEKPLKCINAPGRVCHLVSENYPNCAITCPCADSTPDVCDFECDNVNQLLLHRQAHLDDKPACKFQNANDDMQGFKEMFTKNIVGVTNQLLYLHNAIDEQNEMEVSQHILISPQQSDELI